MHVCKLQPAVAINPPAVFAFGSNSYEMNGRRTLIPAKMGRHPEQMSEPLSSVPLLVPFTGQLQARAGQALQLKGYIRSKVSRCNQPSMFLESQLSTWMKGAIFVPSGTSGLDKNVQPYHSSQRTLSVFYYTIIVYSSTET